MCTWRVAGQWLPGLLAQMMIAVPPSQQASEPSYPDIILIAINRHGVLLIHPKTKVAARLGRPPQAWGSCLVGLPSHPSHTGPPGSSSDSGPLGPRVAAGSYPVPAVPPGPAHHLPLQQDRQLEQRQHVLPHGAGEPGPGQPLAV